ncbi:HAMP domain-containing sensor histidine kinase [Edaphobacter sp.]|uniref:sensor histidine kinase n=1 Tax=Edaphobacter sp. TaxID=1934404 RepID=UPI002DBB00E9|nr:HAMP domain-containing sensor histidine kinase [Edaphobacter sp.]HEU5340894.1 HAMP domain-containing sensor histidine kinase [Edaphobacter sp.]
MKHWRMRTILMASLLAASLGLTATCLLIIRLTVQQEIHKGLNADLSHSLDTFRNISHQRNQMLSREASLLADLPSLKALMVTQDAQTIQDGSHEFWSISGSDLFALASQTGKLFTYSNRGPALDNDLVTRGLHACMVEADDPCTVAFGPNLYVVSIQPLLFGPPANDSQLGYVIIGYSIDDQVARQVSEAAAAEVAFMVDDGVSAATLPVARLSELRSQRQELDAMGDTPRKIQLDNEVYVAAAVPLPAAGRRNVRLVVLKSYDRASEYLHRVNRWIVMLGAFALLIGLALAAAISRMITRPLEALASGARALGQGDFNYRLSPDGAQEVQELSQSFDRMREELKSTHKVLLESDRLATIGRMASSVSHDLRHHLSAIYANAEFMSLPHAGAKERLELLLEVREGIQGMTDLIESLLLFSQTGQTLHLVYESVGQLVERTIHSVRQHPECSSVEICASDLGFVDAWVDPKKLGRAVYNLLLNACQAAKSGKASPVVVVTVSEDEEKIRIAIRDSGPGVPSAIRQTLFQPFVSAGKENGVGLGLTLAQHIAQEHGGEVKIEESMPGKTVFSILLYKRFLKEPHHKQQPDSVTISNINEQIGTAGSTEI